MTIKQEIEKHISEGLTIAQARSLTAQRIILSKIAASKYVDKILLKGGVVMCNITKEQRRTTLDLDFDFEHFDISNNDNLIYFIDVLNTKLPEYKVEISGQIDDLHQQDYKGKRIKVIISDDSESVLFKMDIGVHTLLAIKQEKMCFVFDNGNELMLKVNPPEQIFAEKIFSLAKIGPTSERFKDIDDVYYLIKNNSLDINIVKDCFKLLTIDEPYGLKNIDDVIGNAINTLNNHFFINGYIQNKGSWMKLDYFEAQKIILNFIDKL